MSQSPTRGVLTKDEISKPIADDIPQGAFVNLGIGQPTLVADHLDLERGVVLHTENGMLGMGRTAVGDEIDPDLVNAGKIPVVETAGASYFHHADSFAMMRGGHLDVCVWAPPRCPCVVTSPTGTPAPRTPFPPWAGLWTSPSEPGTCS